MSRLSGCCQFCEENLKGQNTCPSRCEEKVKEELSLLHIDDSQHGDIHSLIRESTNDKGGDNWKYDMCDFCKTHTSLERRLTIDDTSYDFCSSNCLVAAMGRIYRLAVEVKK
ncbi:MAG: hypothetical protein PHG66_04745 [Candidatus Colwellbacteria bacterium]|nr:hypothetical protein [Candidatus Colwellbacteria bacterium]